MEVCYFSCREKSNKRQFKLFDLHEIFFSKEVLNFFSFSVVTFQPVCFICSTETDTLYVESNAQLSVHSLFFIIMYMWTASHEAATRSIWLECSAILYIRLYTYTRRSINHTVQNSFQLTRCLSICGNAPS